MDVVVLVLVAGAEEGVGMSAEARHARLGVRVRHHRDVGGFVDALVDAGEVRFRGHVEGQVLERRQAAGWAVEAGVVGASLPGAQEGHQCLDGVAGAGEELTVRCNLDFVLAGKRLGVVLLRPEVVGAVLDPVGRGFAIRLEEGGRYALEVDVAREWPLGVVGKSVEPLTVSSFRRLVTRQCSCWVASKIASAYVCSLVSAC